MKKFTTSVNKETYEYLRKIADIRNCGIGTLIDELVKEKKSSSPTGFNTTTQITKPVIPQIDFNESIVPIHLFSRTISFIAFNATKEEIAQFKDFIDSQPDNPLGAVVIGMSKDKTLNPSVCMTPQGILSALSARRREGHEVLYVRPFVVNNYHLNNNAKTIGGSAAIGVIRAELIHSGYKIIPGKTKAAIKEMNKYLEEIRYSGMGRFRNKTYRFFDYVFNNVPQSIPGLQY